VLPIVRRARADDALDASWLPAFAHGDKETLWQFAVAFAWAGDHAQALVWLGDAIELGICSHRLWPETDPVIAPLRRTPHLEG
jgi:hypothetical protein